MNYTDDYLLTDLDSNYNFDGDTVQNILGLNELTKRYALSWQCISHHRLDFDIYDYILENSTFLTNIEEEGVKELKCFSYLMKDMFLSLYKYKVDVLTDAEINPAVKINLLLMKMLMETTEWLNLRNHCRVDAYNSTLALEPLSEVMIQIIKQLKEEYQQKVDNNELQSNPIDDLNELFDAEQQTKKLTEQQIQDALSGGQGSGQPGSQGIGSQSGGGGTLSAEQAMQLADALANELAADDNALMQDMENALEELMPQASPVMNNAATEIHETSEFVDAWGFGESEGSNVRISLEGKREAIEKIRNSKKLKDLSDLLGRLKEIAKFEQKRKSKDGASAIKTVEIGNKIENVLPSEKMLLCNKTTKKSFYQKMNQKELLQYKKDSTRKKAKGPMIVCVDTSGSMSGSQEKWSKAVAITLLEIAQTQKRNYACILYSDHIDKTYIIEKGNLNPMDVIDIAERFDSGGTNFEKPLQESLKLIKESMFKNADIVFITDGDCGVSDSFLKEFKRVKEQKEFNVTSILIDAGHHTPEVLKEFSDDILKVSQLAKISDDTTEAVHQLFSKV